MPKEPKYNSTADALNKKNAEVDNIVNHLREGGASEFQCKLIEDCLKHIFTGIMLARIQGIAPAEVEDGLVNIFCMGLMEMMTSRSIPNREAAIGVSQDVINSLGELLSESIADQYKPKLDG